MINKKNHYEAAFYGQCTLTVLFMHMIFLKTLLKNPQYLIGWVQILQGSMSHLKSPCQYQEVLPQRYCLELFNYRNINL